MMNVIFCKQMKSQCKPILAVFGSVESRDRFLSRADILSGDHRVEITEQEARQLSSDWTTEQFNQVISSLVAYH